MPGRWRVPTAPDGPGANESFAVSFIEPRLVAVGNASLVRAAIDQKNGPNVTSNEEMMKLVRSLDSGNAWAVGRFDAIQKQAHLPANMASQIPPITWFSISSHVNGGIRGTVRAETRDGESANNLRDVVGGFVALAKLQAGSKPELQAMMHSLDVSVAGNTVELTFAIPAEAFDALGAPWERRRSRRRSRSVRSATKPALEGGGPAGPPFHVKVCLQRALAVFA